MSDNHNGDGIMPLSRGFWFSQQVPPISQVAVGCMDYRLRDEFSDLQVGGRTVAYRNAGALLSDMFAEIEIFLMQPQHDIRRISVYTHRDCGAVGFVYKVLQGEIEASGEVQRRLVTHLQDPIQREGIDPASLSLSELEEYNAKIKEKLLKPLSEKFEGLIISPAALVDLDHLRKPETMPPVLLYTPVTNTMTHEEIAKMVLGDEADGRKVYLVQRPSVLQAVTDFEIAHALGITDLRFVSLGSKLDKDVAGNVKMLERKADERPFLKEMQMSAVPFDKNVFADVLRTDGHRTWTPPQRVHR